MKLFALFEGEYEDRGLMGIYSSLEKAMGAAPNMDWSQDTHGGEDKSWFGTYAYETASGFRYTNYYEIEVHELDRIHPD